MPFGTRICPACRYSMEGGAVISVTPPRAPWWRRWTSSRTKVSRWRRRRMRPPATVDLTPVAWQWSIIPGLGQMRSHRPWRGFFYFVGVVGLLAVALGLPSQSRMIFTGLASTLHAMSILGLMPREIRHDVKRRVWAMAGIMLGCMAFYFPLTLWLNSIEPQGFKNVVVPNLRDRNLLIQYRDERTYLFNSWITMMALYVAPLLIFGSIVISTLISELISLRWRRRTGAGHPPRRDEDEE